jgi:hypothetical protein
MIRLWLATIALVAVAHAQGASPALWCQAETRFVERRNWAPDCGSYFVNTYENGRRFNPRTVRVWYEIRHGIATHLIDPTSEVRQLLLEGAPVCLDLRVDVSGMRWQRSNELVVSGTRTCNGKDLHRSFVVDWRTGHVLSTARSLARTGNSLGGTIH